MKQWLIILAVFFYFLNATAQIESIELPHGEETILQKHFTPFFNIYVDKNNKVYFEEEPIEIGEIGKQLTYKIYQLPFEQRVYLQIHLFADKNVSYKMVDKIKTEIAATYNHKVVYKTNSIEDKDILKGVFWYNHFSFFKILPVEKQLTNIEQEINKRLNDSITINNVIKYGFVDIPSPPEPPSDWINEFYYKLYSDQQEIIDEALNGKVHRCVTIKNDGIKTDLHSISLDNYKIIEKLFTENDALIMNFDDDLNYSTYLETIRVFISIQKKYKNEKIAFPFEVSSQLVNIHKKAKIKLCDCKY